MVQNIALFSFDRLLSYEVGKLLSEQLDMSFLDTVELFNFDNAPRNQQTVIAEFGLKVYRKSFRSTVKGASFFENTVINVDYPVLSSKDILDIVKQNCLVIFLDTGNKRAYNKIKKTKHSKELAKIYSLKEDVFEKYHSKIQAEADICIKCLKNGELKIVSDIIRHIKEFYMVK